MSTHPFFSILVPTYNHAKYVGAALDSLLAQTDADWEAVVVNDGSTDNTADLLHRYAQRDARIRVIHKPNGGTGSALNRALSEARGDWICWLSSDDFFDPKKLAIHRDWIRRDPSGRFHFTYFRLLIEAKKTTVNHPLWGPLPEREFQVLGLFYRNYISGISICVHRESWETVGQFNERLRYGQDYDMWLRLLARYAGTFVPEWTCTNRNHAGQGSEVFPQACYYDCAAAGVQFLNNHRFEQMFPLIDMRDSVSALQALERTLTHAADDTGFLYGFGAHPCLLARALEWAWDRHAGDEVYRQRTPHRKLAQQMIADTARQLRGTPLGWHWQVAHAAAAMPEPDFTYAPIQPLAIGLAFLHDLRTQGKTEFADLQRYFKMQYANDLPPAAPKCSRRTVVVFDPEPRPADSRYRDELAQSLHAAGCKVVVVTVGPNRLHHAGAMPTLEVQSRQVAERVLSELMPTDTVVWFNATTGRQAFAARQHYLIRSTDGAASIEVAEILRTPATSAQRPQYNAATAYKSRRKVVFVSPRAWGGGAERVTFDLLHALDPGKHELHFVQLFSDAQTPRPFDSHITVHDVEIELKTLSINRKPLAKRLLSRGARTLRTLSDFLKKHLPPCAVKQSLNPHLDSIRQLWPHVVALSEIFRRIGSDALLVPVMEEATIRVWLAQCFASQPYCALLQIAESQYMPVLYPNPARLKIENFLFSSACQSAAMVTMPSQGCKDDLAKHFHIVSDAIEVIPNPISVSSILKSCADEPESPLPALNGKCLFVHAARLCYQKDHELLLRTCSLLKTRTPNFLVACLGEGSLRAEIQRQIDELGLRQNVLVLGEVQNPFAYMARAHGVLLTSRFESFALVLAEAMACGAVPIAVDCPYGPREVLDDGKFGLLVPMNSPEALASAMQRVVEDRDLREKFRNSGRQRARNYELADIASRWESLIETLVPAPTPHPVTNLKTPRNMVQPAAGIERRKVVFIGGSVWGGGAERLTRDLLHKLDPKQYELHFVHLHNNQCGPIHIDSHITVHNLEQVLKGKGLFRYSLWRRALNRIARHLRKGSDRLNAGLPPIPWQHNLEPYLESIAQIWPQVMALDDIFLRIGPDAVLIPVMEEAAVRVWLTQTFHKRPYCASLHTVESGNFPLMFPDPDRCAIERFLFSNACRNAAVVTIPSPRCKRDLVDNFNVPAGLIDVIPNAIDVDAVLAASVDLPETPLPATASAPLFVHIGRLSAEKNHSLMLDACRLLKNRDSDFAVACLGDGPLRDDLQRRILELGLQDNIFLLGAVKNPFAYLARSKGLVLTSRFESFALVLVEALACGTVPIAVDCPYGPREVLNDGEYGLLVPMDNPMALADAMFRVATESDYREKFSRIGMQRARNYDLPKMASQWERIIDGLTINVPQKVNAVASAA